MNIAEAEPLVVAELRRLAARQPHVDDLTGLRLYGRIERAKPGLFKWAGDKWLIVSGWIDEHGLLERP
jgi:hypothetical protein